MKQTAIVNNTAVGDGTFSFLSIHYQGNKMNDVGFANSTKQPYLYDQMAALYNGYIVKASKIRTKLIMYSTVGTATGTVPDDYVVTIIPYYDRAGIVDTLNIELMITDQQVTRYAKSIMILPDGPNMPGGPGIRPKKLRNYANWKKIMGLNWAEAHQVHDLPLDSSPIFEGNWIIYIKSASSTPIPTTTFFRFMTYVTYYVKWVNPKFHLQSLTSTTEIPSGGNATDTLDG